MLLFNAPLAGQTAAVVGMGTLGMGAARQLCLAGVARIVVSNREQSKAEVSAAQLSEELQGKLPKLPEIIALAVDVCDSVSIGTFLESLATAAPGDLDIVLVTSGGNDSRAFFNKVDALRDYALFPTSPVPTEQCGTMSKKWGAWNAPVMHDVYRANATGPIELMYRLGERLTLQDRPPLVLTIGSVSPDLSGVNHYAAAKQALKEETKRYGQHLAWCRREIGRTPGRALSIRWGFTQSEQSKGLLFNEDGSPKFRVTEIMRATPVGRMGTADDFGKLVVVGAINDYLMGELVADGGFSDTQTV